MTTATLLRPLPRNTVFPVKGVSFRQEPVHGIVEGDRVSIVHDPSNEHDHNACAVYSADGSHIGFVPRTLAARLSAPHPGGRWVGEVTAVLRGDTWGLRVKLLNRIGEDAPAATVPPPLRHVGDGVVEHADGRAHPQKPAADSPTAAPEPAARNVNVFAKSGRLLGRLISVDDGKVAVMTVRGIRAVFPADVVRVAS